MRLWALVSGIRLALGTVREHKLRSFLTVLGVIIGTGAVIGVGSIIAGLDTAISNLLRSFGPNTIIVLRGSAMSHLDSGGVEAQTDRPRAGPGRSRPAVPRSST